MCIKSKIYASENGQFSLRYPNDYPLDFRTGSDLVNQYNFDEKHAQWASFSGEFYLNAGGGRLGSIIVEKNTSYRNVKEFEDKTIDNFNKLP